VVAAAVAVAGKVEIHLNSISELGKAFFHLDWMMMKLGV